MLQSNFAPEGRRNVATSGVRAANGTRGLRINREQYFDRPANADHIEHFVLIATENAFARKKENTSREKNHSSYRPSAPQADAAK